MNYNKDLYELGKYLYNREIENKNEIEKSKQFHLSMFFALTTLISYLYKKIATDKGFINSVKFSENLILPIGFFILVLAVFFAIYVFYLIKLYGSKEYKYINPREIIGLYSESKEIYEKNKDDFVEPHEEVLTQTLEEFIDMASNNQDNNKQKSDEILKVKKYFIINVCIVLVEMIIFYTFI